MWQALALVTIAAILCFGLYTALKAAYLSTVFATLILERNLIYLVPLLFAGTALFFQRRGGRWWAVVAAACFALYLVHTTPYALDPVPELRGARPRDHRAREPHLPLAGRHDRARVRHRDDRRDRVSCILLPRLRGRQIAVILAAVLAAFTLAWTGTAEVYAAHGEQLFSEQLYATLPKPPNWLDKRDARPIGRPSSASRSRIRIRSTCSSSGIAR